MHCMHERIRVVQVLASLLACDFGHHPHGTVQVLIMVLCVADCTADWEEATCIACQHECLLMHCFFCIAVPGSTAPRAVLVLGLLYHLNSKPPVVPTQYMSSYLFANK